MIVPSESNNARGMESGGNTPYMPRLLGEGGHARQLGHAGQDVPGQDVQHHRPGEPVGSIPLSVSETDVPHHAGANPNAKPKVSEES